MSMDKELYRWLVANTLIPIDVVSAYQLQEVGAGSTCLKTKESTSKETA